MTNNKKERAFYIDAVKGLAILCITFLHFEQGVIPQWLNVWIGMFMITTFYFTSGWVSGMQDKKMATKELFKKRIRQLGVPYLWFSALILVFDIVWVLCGFMETEILFREIYKTITLRGIGTLWFLPVLIIGETIFCYIRNHKHKIFIGVVGLLFTIFVSYCYFDIWSPLRELSTTNKIIDSLFQPTARGITSWPVIAIGYLFYKYVWNKINTNKYILFFTGIIIIAFSLLLIVVPPFKIYYVNSILSNFLPTIGFICLFAICKNNNYINRFFIYWGINSLILMCTHYSITEEVFKIFNAKILHQDFNGWITILYFILTIILTYPLVTLFNGKLRFMLGKK